MVQFRLTSAMNLDRPCHQFWHTLFDFVFIFLHVLHLTPPHPPTPSPQETCRSFILFITENISSSAPVRVSSSFYSLFICSFSGCRWIANSLHLHHVVHVGSDKAFTLLLMWIGDFETWQLLKLLFVWLNVSQRRSGDISPVFRPGADDVNLLVFDFSPVISNAG